MVHPALPSKKLHEDSAVSTLNPQLPSSLTARADKVDTVGVSKKEA